jgi:putative tryptophan/tyrosine transport system substrate-binding protein
MRRREFITLLGGIGRQAPPVVAFFDELRLNGFIERQNITAVAGSFGLEGRPFAERAATVVTAAPDVIVTGGNPATRAVHDATGTLPIVDISNDMVGEGLVRSLARPGRNSTGVTILSPELDGKRQDLLIEVAPRVRRVAARPQYTTPQQLQALQDAA